MSREGECVRNQPRRQYGNGRGWLRTEGGSMESTTLDAPRRTTNGRPASAEAAESTAISTAAHQAFWLLRIGFTVAPILFGLDKFFNWSVNWPDYLANW